MTGSTCFAGTANSDAVEMILQVMEIIFALITALLTPAVILAGWLLSPDWTMGDFFGLRKYFINVWVLVSNLVYIAFALILLFMAVMQIFGGENSEYTFKKKLPQFLVGILMVPFTWLIVSWTLSFANQATAAILAIPMGAIAQMQTDGNGDRKDKGMFHEKVIPTHISSFLTAGGQNPTTEVDCASSATTSSSTGCISAAEFVANNASGPYFIMMIYAYDIFKIQKTDLVRLSNKDNPLCNKDTDAQKCIKSLVDVVIKVGTGLIVVFFFGVLTIALCWVLLMRAFKLWIYVMFSPLFGLAFFTGNGWWEAFKSEWGGDHGWSSGISSLWFMPFFRLAMVPVLVSAVLSFGLLFVGVISQTFTVTNMSSWGSIGGTMCTQASGYMVRYCIIPTGNTADGSQGYNSQLIIGSPKTGASTEWYTPIVFEFGEMFSGTIGNSAANSAISGANGIVDSVESVFAHVILTLISLVIIWMWVKAAVQHDEITKKAFEPFAKLGDSVGHFVQHIPSYIPTPHPAFKLATPGGITALAEKIHKGVDDTVDEEKRNIKDIIWNPRLLSLQTAARWELQEFNNELKNTSVSARNLSSAIDSQKIALENMVKASKEISDADKPRILRDIRLATKTTELAAIIDKDLAGKIKDKKSQETFELIREGAKATPAAQGAVFSGVSVNDSGVVKGLWVTNPNLEMREVSADAIKRNWGLTTAQTVAVRENRDALKDKDRRRDALQKIWIVVPTGRDREKKEEEIANALIQAAS